MCLATEVSGELIPIPTFSNHDVPTTEVPHTDAAAWDVVHVGLLLLALVLATYFALVSRSRKHLLVLAIASLIWFGFVREGCVCSVGSTQNVTHAMFDTGYTIPLGVLAFFVLPLVFTLFFGRTFLCRRLPAGGCSGSGGRAEPPGATLAGSCLGPVSVHLSGGGRTVRGDGHGLHHLPI